MTLEQFIPGLKRRCSDCGAILPEGETRWLEKKGEKKALCRDCFGRRFGRQENRRGLEISKHHRRIIQKPRKFPKWVCSCGEEHYVLSEEDIVHYDFLHSIKIAKEK